MSDLDEMMTNKEAITLLIMIKRNASFWQCIAIDKAVEALKEQEQKKGEWIDLGGVFECSFCHERSCCGGNYCPDCGAEMEGEE